MFQHEEATGPDSSFHADVEFKKLEKVKFQLGNDTIEEMDAMFEEDLRRIIVSAQGAMQEAKEELEANREYQRAKLAIRDLSAAKKEVDQRQKAKTVYALHRLQELGKQ